MENYSKAKDDANLDEGENIFHTVTQIEEEKRVDVALVHQTLRVKPLGSAKTGGVEQMMHRYV